MTTTPVDPQFVLEHAAHVRALAARLVFDGTHAEDLEQETWLAALKNAPREMTSPRGWLARIAQRRVVHDWRAETRRAAREQDAVREDAVASPEEILEREETRTHLVRAVLALDDPYRSALVAQFLEERAPGEAARRRGVPVETQRTHVRRGLELLRERLKRAHGAAFGAFQLALVRDLRIEAPVGATLAAAGSGLVVGGLSMWTAKKVVALVLVVAAVWLVAARPWEAPEAPLAAGARVETAQIADAVDVAQPTAPAERAPAAADLGVAADESGSVASAAPEAAVVVRARIVDDSGRPIAGAIGVLSPYSAPRSAAGAPRATSDADGVLRIEAPSTTASDARLTIDGGPWRTRAERTFQARNLERIVPGTNDAGELMLRPAGRIRGRVTADGAPVAEARVQALSPVWTSAEMTATSDRDGAFVIDSVDPSVSELRVSVGGSVLRVATPSVEVQAGVERDVGEIALHRAPTIEGRVVDTHEQPIAGAVVRAKRVGDVRLEHVATAADGTFALRAPDAGDYDLTVDASHVVRAWGSNGTQDARFATGERDVRIVLDRVPVTTFRVLDQDGAPVREFGLGVRPFARVRESGDDGMDYDEQWPRIVERDAHEVSEPAEPGLHEVFVASPGFVPLRVPVAHDTAGSATQTLHLRRGRALRGRVVRDGTGLASAQVVVERAWIPLGPAPSQPGSIEPGHTHTQDVAGFAGRRRDALTGADGRFELNGVPAGTYDVRVASGGEVVARVDLFSVPATADGELGDIVIRAGATVRGVLDAGARSPIGWTVSISGRASLVIDRVDGRFEFTGLGSGAVELTWYHESAFGLARVGLGGERETSRSMRLDLVDGATRDVRIDVAELVPARVTITVRADGVPLADVMPFVVMRIGEGTQSAGRGSTRADGTWSGLVVPGIPTRFQVETKDGLPLAWSDELVLAPGEHREIALDARTGVLQVRLPDDVAAAGVDVVRVDVRPRGVAARAFLIADWRTKSRAGRAPQGTWDGAALVSGRVGEGEWTATVQVFLAKPTSPTSESFEPRMPAVEREITIRAGETTVFDLR